jgi:Esterase-like activity of phytase
MRLEKIEMKKSHRNAALRLGVLCLALALADGAQAVLTITDVGRFDFTDTGGSGARELSGITYTGGSSYLSIGDKEKLLHTLSINLNPANGQITSASIDPTPVTLSSSFNGDREGIAVQGNFVLTTNEEGPQLEAFDAATGASTGTPVNTANPGYGIYAQDRPNRAWESLAIYQNNTSTILFANEDALIPDGPAAGFTQGAVVRIQASSADAANSTATAIGQFAYPTDAINGDSPFTTSETSGLVELLTLPNNRVLAMERSVGQTGYRIRLYQVKGGGATDISGLSGLAGLTPGVDYTPVGKTLLWEKTFSALTNSNFEGIALGPVLGNGELSLLLVADNASGPVLPFVGQQWTVDDQSLYALSLAETSGPVCPTDCLLADGDGDGFVGIADLNLILARWNQVVFPGVAADPSADGFVGIDDLNEVLSNWNTGVPPIAGPVVPEPSSGIVALVLTSVLMARMR